MAIRHRQAAQFSKLQPCIEKSVIVVGAVTIKYCRYKSSIGDMLFQPYLTVNFSTPPSSAGEISQIEIEVNNGTLSLILTTVAEQCNGQIISYDVSLENSQANCYHDISPN